MEQESRKKKPAATAPKCFLVGGLPALENTASGDLTNEPFHLALAYFYFFPLAVRITRRPPRYNRGGGELQRATLKLCCPEEAAAWRSIEVPPSSDVTRTRETTSPHTCTSHHDQRLGIRGIQRLITACTSHSALNCPRVISL